MNAHQLPMNGQRTKPTTGWRAWLLGSIRNKILASFFGITLLIMITFGTVATFVTRSQTLADVGQTQQNTADSQARAMGDFLTRQVDSLTIFSSQFTDIVVQANSTYSGDQTAIQAEVNRLDKQWIAADKADNDADPLVASRLNNATAARLRDYRVSFPENVETFITDRYGANIAVTNRTSDYNQADEAWWQTTYNNGAGNAYIGELQYDDSSKTFSSNIAVPVFGADKKQVIGVLRTTVTAQSMLDLFASSSLSSQIESVDLLLPSGKELVSGKLIDTTPQDQAALRSAARPYSEFAYAGVQSFVSVAPVSGDQAFIKDLGWLVVVHKHSTDALAPVNAQLQIIIIVGLVIAALAVGFSFLFARTLSAPLVRLTHTAGKVATGDLTAEAQVDSGDEIGQLAATFNNMTQQLRELVRSLEQSVANRTKALTTSTEVSRSISAIMNPHQLVIEVVEQVKAAFSYYHAHIYLLDEVGENLVLAAGAGEPGRQMMAKGHSIPLNREHSLVARAARERRSVSVNDVTLAADFLSNPLLPNTRSELAVPLIIGDQILGVFDVQSDQTGRFTDAEINIQNSLAAQIAIAVQNGRLYMESMQFKLGIERSGDAVFATDSKGIITYANPAFEKVYGYTPAEVIGKNPRIIKSGLLTPETYKTFWGTLLSKNSVDGEIVNKHKDGHLVYVAGTNSAIIDDSGEIIGFLAVHHDITESKQTQEILAQRAAQLQKVSIISAATASTREEQELLTTVVKLTQRQFGFYHVHVFTYQPETDELKIAACGWQEGDEHEGDRENKVISISQQQSLVARAARTRQAVIVNDVHKEEGWLPNPFLPNTAAELATPLVVGDQLLGVLDVQADHMDAFTEEDATIQTTLVSQIGIALQNARSFELARQQAQRETTLNLISQRIQSATTVESAMKIAARELGHALGRKPTLVTLDPAALAGDHQGK